MHFCKISYLILIWPLESHFHGYASSDVSWLNQISDLVCLYPLKTHFHCYYSLDAFRSNIDPYWDMAIGIPLLMLCQFRCILVKYRTLFAYIHWGPAVKVMLTCLKVRSFFVTLLQFRNILVRCRTLFAYVQLFRTFTVMSNCLQFGSFAVK